MAPSFYLRDRFQVMDEETDALLNSQPHTPPYTRLRCTERRRGTRQRTDSSRASFRHTLRRYTAGCSSYPWQCVI